jgi:lysozyme family protein
VTDAQIIDAIIEREGGFVDHPSDKGGPTKFGITAATLSEHRGGTMVDATDVEHLTIDEARIIYRQRYLVRPGFDKVTDDNLRALLVDWGVHSGPANAIRGLQRALNVAPDGVLGPITLLALPHLDARKVYAKTLAARARFIAAILQRDESQRVFAAGWINRLAEFVEGAA